MSDEIEIAKLAVRVDGLDRLMEAKYVTFSVLVESQAEKVALALTSSEKAIAKAEDATEKRFDAVNEFRAQLADQATTFVRVDYMQQALESRDALIAANTERIRELELARSSGAGGQARVVDQRASIATAVAVLGVLITVIVIAANVLSSR